MKPLPTALTGIGLAAVATAAFLSVPVVKVVTRSRTMGARAEAIYAPASDLTRWKDWLKPTNPHVEGSDQATVDELSWVARNDSAQRRNVMRIVEREPNKRVVFEFQIGDRTNLRDELSFSEKGEQTDVTWVRHITLVGIAKLAPLIYTPESIVGPQLESALKDLEAGAKPH